MSRFLDWLLNPLARSEADRDEQALLDAYRAEARIRREQMRPKVVCVNCRREHLVQEIQVTDEWGIILRYRCPNDAAEVSGRCYDISQAVYRPAWSALPAALTPATREHAERLLAEAECALDEAQDRVSEARNNLESFGPRRTKCARCGQWCSADLAVGSICPACRSEPNHAPAEAGR